MRNSGEDVGTVSGGSLDAITMVDASLAGFVVYVEVGQVVVEVNRSRTKIATQKGRMSSENGGDIDVPFSAERNCESHLPFVEVRDDGGVKLTRCKLPKEPSYKVAEHNRLVGFVVIWWSGDTSEVPEVAFPLIQAVVLRTSVEEEYTGGPFYEPPAIEYLYAALTHGS